MSQIFLAPRSSETSYENFSSTILEGRTYRDIEPYLDESEKKDLSRFDVLKIWGNKESLRSRWSKMQRGDHVLFYAKGIFYYSARVELTKFSPELGRKLWPVDTNGEPWSCLFFIDSLREVQIPIQVVQELAGYEPTWDRVLGFMKLNDAGTAAISQQFGSIEAFLSQPQATYEALDHVFTTAKEEHLEDAKEAVIDKEQLLHEARAFYSLQESHRLDSSSRRVRIENRQQKKRVAALEDYACQICDWSLEWINSKNKKSYRIDVDHIIDKADGGGEELDNLWVLCPNCHVKKTLGVITIDPARREITENGRTINLHHDNHLGWSISDSQD